MMITRTQLDVLDQFQSSLDKPLPQQMAVLERWVIHSLPSSPSTNPAALILLHVWQRIQKESREDLKALLCQQTRIHRAWSYLFIDVWTSRLGYAHTTYPFDMPRKCPQFLELDEVINLLNEIPPTLILDLNASWLAIKRLACTAGTLGFKAFYRYFTPSVPKRFHPITWRALSEQDLSVAKFIRDQQLISEEVFYQLFVWDTEKPLNWFFILNELSPYYFLHAILSILLRSDDNAWKMKQEILFASSKDFTQITDEQWEILKELFHQNRADVQKGFVVQLVLNDANDILMHLQRLPLFLDPQAKHDLAEQLFHHLSKEEFHITGATWLAKWDLTKKSLYENACVRSLINYIQRAADLYQENCSDPSIWSSREMTPLQLTSAESSHIEEISLFIKTPEIASLLAQYLLPTPQLEPIVPILFNLIQGSPSLSRAFAPHYDDLYPYPSLQMAIAIEDLTPEQQIEQLQLHPFRLMSLRNLTN